MTVILDPPYVVAHDLLQGPRGVARAIKRLTNTPIDIKTISKFLRADGSEGKVRQLIRDMFSTWQPPEATKERWRSEAELPGPVTWAAFVEGAENGLPLEAIEESPFRRHLLALEQASLGATELARNGNFQDAAETMRHPILVRCLPELLWATLRSARTMQDLEKRAEPMRLVSRLVILACFERWTMPNEPESLFRHYLPKTDEGALVSPFATCFRRLDNWLGFEDTADALRSIMQNAGDSERRKYKRWLDGEVTPSEAEFRSHYERALRFHQTRSRINAPPDLAALNREATRVYWGLKYLDSLRGMPLSEHFGTNAAFFSLYPRIFDEAK